MPNIFPRRVIILSAFVCILINCTDVNADLVVNGDFETGDRSGWTWEGQPDATDDVVPFDVFGSDGPSLAFKTNPTVSYSNLNQNIFLREGTDYTLSWEMAMQNTGNEALQSTGDIEVRIGNQVLAHWHQGFLSASSSTGLQESKSFTVTSTDFYELKFLFKREPNTTVSMYLDNVSAIPEPTSFVLFSISLVGMFRRRRFLAV